MSFVSYFKKEPLLIFLFLLLIILILLFPHTVIISAESFPLRTLIAIISLMIITTAIEESNYLVLGARRILRRIDTEIKLSLFLVFLSAFLSLFLTNDIALFIMIPLTLELERKMKNDVNKIIIFEAIAVNVGSSLTPIGNPQNLYMWHIQGISFLEFISQMIIPTTIGFIILIIFILLSFPNRSIEIKEMEKKEKYNSRMFFISLSLLVIFIVILQLGLEYHALIAILLIYTFLDWRIFKKVDWMLIVIFAFIFLIFGAIPLLFSNLFLKVPTHTFLTSALLSQAISNVPASVVMTHISSNYREIAWGVNVGGNGFILASLANIIALRISKKNSKRMYVKFHKYSLPFFAISLVLIYILLIIGL